MFSFSWTITENSLDLCLSYLWFWFCDFDYVPPFCAIDGAGGEEADYKKKTSSEQKRPWYDSWHGSFSRFCHLYQFFDSLRAPLFQVAGKTIESGQSALVLSLEQGIGIVAGLSFASLIGHFKNRLLPIVMFLLAVCLFGMSVAGNLPILILSSVGVGFFYSIILTIIFNRLSESIARNLLNKATAYVLLGCNLGSAISPYVLKLLALISPSFSWIFLAYAIVSFLLFLGFFLNAKMAKKV